MLHFGSHHWVPVLWSFQPKEKKGKAQSKELEKIVSSKELAEAAGFRQLNPGVFGENLRHPGGRCGTENPAKGLEP